MPNWKKLIVSGSDAALNSLNVTSVLTASGLIYPTADGDNGDFLLTDGAGNLSFAKSTVFANVKNVSGVTLQKGTPVHATGTAGNASEVIAASASVASTMPATYVLNETLADDAEGLALITGYINGVDTSAFGEGDVMYVGATGSFTNVKPGGSDNLIQNLGIVNKVDASNGSGYVYGSGRSNDVPNLPEGKVWVGSSTYSVTSSIVTLDEDNSHAQITGSLSVSSVVNAGTDTDKFLVLDSSNNVDFRTGAEVRSDIGAGTGNGTVTGTGADNQVATWNGTTSLDGSSNFTYDGTTLDLTYTGTGDLLRLTSTDAGASSAPDLTFCRNSASPADDDTLGTAQFWGKSTAPANKLYAAIYGRIACATSGQTKGNISFKQECDNVFIDTANFSPYGLYVLPPSFNSMTTPGIGLTVTGGVSGSTTLQIGSGHTNSGTLSTIGGGSANSISSIGNCSFIGSGLTNTVEACWSAIGSGQNNCIKCDFASWSIIGGGRDNLIYSNGGLPPTLAYYSAILGGCGNQISDTGGNSKSACFSSILGGQSNIVTSCHSSIAGGTLNTGSGAFGFIGGGRCNNICSGVNYSSIVGGGKNTVDGDYSSIIGGLLNTASAACTGILGGESNYVNHTKSFIVGSNLTSDKACYTFMNNLDVEGTVSASIFSGSFVGNGSGLTGTGGQSIIDGTAAANQIAVFNSTTTISGSGNLTYDGTTLDTNGNLDVAGTVRLGYTGTDPVILGNPAGKRTEWNNPGYFEIYAEDIDSPGTFRETIDIDGDYGGGGFIGVYPSNTTDRSGVHMWSQPDAGRNQFVINPFPPSGVLRDAEIEASYISGSSAHPGAINYTGSFITVSSSYDNKITIGTCVTDANVGSNNLYVVGDVAGTTKLTIGSNHCNTGTLSSIAGGTLNTASAACSFIGGGCGNIINSNAPLSFVGGGRGNEICSCDYGIIVGGLNNTINAGSTLNIIVGGNNNCITGLQSYGFIGGGFNNLINGVSGGSYQVIGGGCGNIACYYGATIAGGMDNVTCYYGTIGGGYQNQAYGCHSTIAGGCVNCVTGHCSGIGGGNENEVTANHTSIVGGTSNTSAGAYSFIGGGFQNTLDGSFSGILGGRENTITHNDSFAIGAFLTSSKDNYAYMNNICLLVNSGEYSLYRSGSNADISLLQGFQPTTSGSAVVYKNNADNLEGIASYHLANSTVLWEQGYSTGSQGVFTIDVRNNNEPVPTGTTLFKIKSGYTGNKFSITQDGGGSCATPGIGNVDIGPSFNFGNNSYSNGSNALAIGAATTAWGDSSFATGILTLAEGQGSAAFNLLNEAIGGNSVAFGNKTKACGQFSATFGQDSIAGGINSLTIGEKGIASGSRSFASGFCTRACNNNASSFGFNTQALGPNSFAGGYQSEANGSSFSSFAFGECTTASGINSVAFGKSTLASGNNSIALNANSIACATNSTAIAGGEAKADQTFAHVGIACAYRAVAFQNAVAAGLCSFAVGDNNRAEAAQSVVFGKNNCTRGDQGITAGVSNDNCTNNTAMFGKQNLSCGFYGNSIIGGSSNTSAERNQLVMGECNIASQPHQTVLGQYADATRSNSIFVIGVGASAASRANALEVVDTATPRIIMQGLKDSPSYANDSAAGTGGVPVGGLYRNGNVVQIRLS